MCGWQGRQRQDLGVLGLVSVTELVCDTMRRRKEPGKTGDRRVLTKRSKTHATAIASLSNPLL